MIVFEVKSTSDKQRKKCSFDRTNHVFQEKKHQFRQNDKKWSFRISVRRQVSNHTHNRKFRIIFIQFLQRLRRFRRIFNNEKFVEREKRRVYRHQRKKSFVSKNLTRNDIDHFVHLHHFTDREFLRYTQQRGTNLFGMEAFQLLVVVK